MARELALGPGKLPGPKVFTNDKNAVNVMTMLVGSKAVGVKDPCCSLV